MGLLERCHSYKDKLAHGSKPSHGLFSYPVLMAADILIYDSDIVPVGKDQVQHLEVTRDIAIKINERYGEGTLKLPTAKTQEHTAKVPGLDGEKMSKSYNNTIAVFEEGKPLKKKIMGIKTDSTPVEEPKDTENSIILDLYKLVAADEEVAAMKQDFGAGGIGYGEFKKRLLSAVDDYFAPLREERVKVEKDPDFVEDVLRSGAARAREQALIVLDRVKTAVGL
jgi:tryptophanyl-tRNA synthetase